MERPRIHIGWLYPEYMNLYGDRGNIIVLTQRSRWHGLAPVVTQVRLGETADFAQFDLLMMGGGQDREQSLIADDFMKVKGSSLGDAIEDGLAVLAVCGGYQMLGKYFKTHTGEMIRFTGILDLWTEGGKERMIGNCVVESDLFGGTRTIVGFENHSGRTYLGKGLRPLGRVVKGYGNNGADRTEGVVYKNTVGTYLHGSILPKNPHLADWLIQRALDRRYGGEVKIGKLNDDLEMRAHEAIIARFGR
ncbi:CobQ-like glutamine amidotransferase family enzyme [Symbiobacterium terraclitae]|uniref:Lipid II isoglutaminyl synthase (glutamine-hydrolyzing) subunit GatD n=1 Tax=Symbiobacterium terraclitae TaxID=557451 RepID=A0ABS4JU65_9FIRM|nr:CobQ-like glutamine amidotransferase family enzyme [Symbiobacterium terraclitae]